MKETNWQGVVKHITEQSGITQGALALRCEVSQQTISNIKNNVRGPGIGVRKELRQVLHELGADESQFEEEITSMMSDPKIKVMLAALERADRVKRAQIVATVMELLK